MLHRIELRDSVAGDWRGLFRATHNSERVAYIINNIAKKHAQPYHLVDLTRVPKFFFTEKAWKEFACDAYWDIVSILGDGVKVIAIHPDTPMVEQIDEYQAVLYTR